METWDSHTVSCSEIGIVEVFLDGVYKTCAFIVLTFFERKVIEWAEGFVSDSKSEHEKNQYLRSS